MKAHPSVRPFVVILVVGLSFSGMAHADDWPQWMGPQRDGVWRETGIIDRLPVGGPSIVWRTNAPARAEPGA